MSKCRGCLVNELPLPVCPPNYRPGKGRWLSEIEYAHRLAMCHSCPSLIAKTTCAFCGCVVAFSAAFKDKKCPHPEGSRWTDYY